MSAKKYPNHLFFPELILSGILIFTALTYLGCRKNQPSTSSSGSQSSSSTYSFDEEALREIATVNHLPLWTPDDLEINKYSGSTFVSTTSIFERPKFYNGKMPLEIRNFQKLGEFGSYTYAAELCYEFEDFKTYFIYDNLSHLKGIAAIDKANTLIAEAKLEYDLFTRERVMQEFHYSEGGKNLIFFCRSKIDRRGMKTEETGIKGKKERDYFFIMSDF